MANFDLDAIRRRQAAARAEAIPAPDTRHLARIEIENCGMCDDDGYRGASVCDHRDHSAAAARGMALVRAALAKPPKVAQRGGEVPQRPHGDRS